MTSPIWEHRCCSEPRLSLRRVCPKCQAIADTLVMSVTLDDGLRLRVTSEGPLVSIAGLDPPRRIIRPAIGAPVSLVRPRAAAPASAAPANGVANVATKSSATATPAPSTSSSASGVTILAAGLGVVSVCATAAAAVTWMMEPMAPVLVALVVTVFVVPLLPRDSDTEERR